jgi:hypothetical protein
MILEVFEAEKADVESANMVVSHRIVGSHSISLLLPAAVIDLLVPILKAPLQVVLSNREPRAQGMIA